MHHLSFLPLNLNQASDVSNVGRWEWLSVLWSSHSSSTWLRWKIHRRADVSKFHPRYVTAGCSLSDSLPDVRETKRTTALTCVTLWILLGLNIVGNILCMSTKEIQQRFSNFKATLKGLLCLYSQVCIFNYKLKNREALSLFVFICITSSWCL